MNNFTKKNLIIVLALVVLIIGLLIGCLGDSQQGYQEEYSEKNQTPEIKIAAFNIQIFGKTKREKENVMNILTKIAKEFDIIFVQEIRDKEEKTASYYCQKINEAVGYNKYDFIRSNRLGRSQSKEAYAYLYNTDKAQLIEGSEYVYDDVNDFFEREPYIASFKSGCFDFTLAGIHIKPDDADAEIGYLVDVVNSILVEKPN